MPALPGEVVSVGAAGEVVSVGAAGEVVSVVPSITVRVFISAFVDFTGDGVCCCLPVWLRNTLLLSSSPSPSPCPLFLANEAPPPASHLLLCCW